MAPENAPRPEYEGWANYETWAVHLWLANDQGYYTDARVVAHDGVDAESAMRDYVEEIIFGDEAPATLGTDLISHALAYVDWPAVVESFLSRNKRRNGLRPVVRECRPEPE